MFPEDDEDSRKRTRIMFELIGVAHAGKRYMDSLAESQGLPRPEAGRGISGTNLFILAYLYENRDREIYQKDLEEKMNVRRSTVSKVLRIMEEKALIRREQVAQDGRLKRIVLTQHSMEGIRRWLSNSRKVESKMTGNFTDEELDQFYYLLNKAKENLQSSSKGTSELS